MESLAAVSLAGNVLQFIDFAKKLVSGTIEIHGAISGSTSEHSESEEIARRLREFASELTAPELNGPLETIGDDKELQNIGVQCKDICDEILSMLGGLKVQPGDGWLESFCKALRGEWEKSNVQSLQSRLDRLSNSLSNTIITKQVHRMRVQLARMMQQNERLAARREEDIRNLKNDLSEEFLTALHEEGDRIAAGLVLSVVGKQGAGYSAEQVILSLLRFQTMDERHDRILSAHKDTYEWVFKSKDYLLWLSEDSRLYWISGKPGSGKSTLMKHIAHHPDTKDQLKQWSDGQEVITAQFYLWSASRTSLMKSQEGLLRSILFQILREAPGLISSAFPEQWNVLMQGHTSRFDQIQDILSVAELMKAFSRVSEQIRETHLKFCFFLDGLDEYDGRPGEIIQMVQLLRSSNVKLCVSSRPWNEFEDAFGRQISIYMQDLNHGDIKAYVIDAFEENEQFQELATAEGTNVAEELQQYIVKAADGVFLWVYLVVRSLLEGLSNADNLTNLRRRLYSLPTDLEEYFERILFTVDEFYEDQTPTVFLVCLAATDTLPLMTYWFIDCLKDNMDYTMDLKIEPMTPQRMFGRHKAMKKRLMACSKGLLEDRFVHTGKNDSISSSVLFNTRVEYLHRTVRDFLRVPERQQRLWERASATSAIFNAELNICQALLGMMKIVPQEQEVFAHNGPIAGLLQTLFQLIPYFEDESVAESLQMNFMASLDRTIQEHSQIIGDDVMACLPWITIKPEFPKMLLGSVEVGQLRYVRSFLDSSKPSDHLSASLLYHSLRPQWVQNAQMARNTFRVTEFLLKRGIGPSLALDSGKSVWEAVLDDLAMEPVNLDSTRQETIFEQLRILLDNGVDFEIVRPTSVPGNCVPAQSIVERILDDQQYLRLVNLWEEKKPAETSSHTSQISQGRQLLQRPLAKAVALKAKMKERLGK